MVNEPENFSWVDEFIAGSAKPQILEHLKFYTNEGIGKIISLNVERPIVMHDKKQISIVDVHLPVYSTPSEIVVKRFIDEVKESQKKNEKVVVHCQFGQERTGQMLAIYRIEIKKMRRDDAINYLRSKRPISLRTQTAMSYLENKYQ